MVGKKRNLFDQLAGQVSETGTFSTVLPIVEIAGEKRVLVENHCGVAAYQKDEILIRVPFGMLCVNGSCLVLKHMTKDQLVISGRIDAVILQRRR